MSAACGAQNYAFRKNLGAPLLPGRIILSPGALALTQKQSFHLLEAVRDSEACEKESEDPLFPNMHDFGAVRFEEKVYFWKIERFTDKTCVRRECEWTDNCYRLLTVMLDSEC